MATSSDEEALVPREITSGPSQPYGVAGCAVSRVATATLLAVLLGTIAGTLALLQRRGGGRDQNWPRQPQPLVSEEEEVVGLQDYAQYDQYGQSAQPSSGTAADYPTQGYAAAATAGGAMQAQPQQQAGYSSGLSLEQAGGSYVDGGGGPLEFTGNGGPRTIAGTKLVDATTDDIATNLQNSHVPEPYPPKSYKEDNPPLTVMLYRAQGEQDYPQRNVDLADLAGVMWYLHNEILAFPDRDYRIRHFNITRILRFKAVIWNPQPWYQANKRKLGPFVAYNAGKCSAEGCDRYAEYGGVVGCQRPDTSVANYKNLDGGDATWVSLPGPCPLKEYGAKTGECIRASPGGDCGEGNPVTGAKDCSYHLEYYGHVPLDEFLPVWSNQKVTFQQFHDRGGQEYDKGSDSGTYDEFWNNVHDEVNCERRMRKVVETFDRLYPEWSEESNSYKSMTCDSR